jgi:hypothetical protein
VRAALDVLDDQDHVLDLLLEEYMARKRQNVDREYQKLRDKEEKAADLAADPELQGLVANEAERQRQALEDAREEHERAKSDAAGAAQADPVRLEKTADQLQRDAERRDRS